MHHFILELPNSQLHEYRTGIDGLTAKPVKNGILAESAQYGSRLWCDFKFHSPEYDSTTQLLAPECDIESHS